MVGQLADLDLCYNRLVGEVAEWLKALVSKTGMGENLIVGSNPTLSVNILFLKGFKQIFVSNFSDRRGARVAE